MKKEVIIPLRPGEEFIRLGQALKAARAVDQGAEAKYAINEGLVCVNGKVETQRGKKLRPGDTAEYKEYLITISGEDAEDL